MQNQFPETVIKLNQNEGGFNSRMKCCFIQDF